MPQTQANPWTVVKSEPIPPGDPWAVVSSSAPGVTTTPAKDDTDAGYRAILTNILGQVPVIGPMLTHPKVQDAIIDVAKTAKNNPVQTGAILGGIAAAPFTEGLSIPAAMAVSGGAAATGAAAGLGVQDIQNRNTPEKIPGVMDSLKLIGEQGLYGAIGEGVGQGLARGVKVATPAVTNWLYRLGLRPTPAMANAFPNAVSRGVEDNIIPRKETIQKALTAVEDSLMAEVKAADAARPKVAGFLPPRTVDIPLGEAPTGGEVASLTSAAPKPQGVIPSPGGRGTPIPETVTGRETTRQALGGDIIKENPVRDVATYPETAPGFGGPGVLKQPETATPKVALSPDLWKSDPLQHVVDVPWPVAQDGKAIHETARPLLADAENFTIGTVKPQPDWIATQTKIDSRDVPPRAFTADQASKAYKMGGANTPPTIVKLDGKTYIIEGHHRFSTAMKNDDRVRAVILDLDKVKPNATGEVSAVDEWGRTVAAKPQGPMRGHIATSSLAFDAKNYVMNKANLIGQGGRGLRADATAELSALADKYLKENPHPMTLEQILSQKRAEQTLASTAYQREAKGGDINQIETLWHQGLADANRARLIKMLPGSEAKLAKEQDLLGLLDMVKAAENRSAGNPVPLNRLLEGGAVLYGALNGHPMLSMASGAYLAATESPTVSGAMSLATKYLGKKVGGKALLPGVMRAISAAYAGGPEGNQ